MSHFTCLVVSPAKPTEEVLNELLLPYHEYECTGIEMHLQDVDKTAEVEELFNKPQQIVVCYPPALTDQSGVEATGGAQAVAVHHDNAPLGTVFSRWDQRFYTGPAEAPFPGARKTFQLPAGAVEVEMTAEEARKHGIGHATLTECATDEYGAFERDGRFYVRTNPNARWDWWKLGGRWCGMLLPKSDAKPDVDYLLGEPGLMGSKHSNDGVDAVQRKNLDLDRMCETAIQHRRDAWAECVRISTEKGLVTDPTELDAIRAQFGAARTKEIAAWKEMVEAAERAKRGIATDRRTFWQMNFPEHLSPYAPVFEDFGERVDLGQRPIEDWIKDAPPFSTHAVLKDGEWFERGKMGWWAIIVSDEMGEMTWSERFAELVQGTDPEHWFAIVDCHI